MYTVTDLFCGAGGSGLGATAVPGVELVMAANHSPQAIETHQANFPGCDHDCADISQVEPRRYRRTDILWASPECTNHSIAKGKRQAKNRDQGVLFGEEPVPDHVAERSRATMWDVPRFVEAHRHDVVIVENVVDAAKWEPFRAWLAAMDCLGYDHWVVSLNSMHAPAIAVPRAPQSRDRMYVVFWRKGNPAPDLDIRPAAWCPVCEAEVAAVQWWKPGRDVGRYRQQYLYRCPNTTCRNTVVEPYVAPAASVIDWSKLGERIGDRDTPLSEKTMERIRAGLERYARPMTFEATSNTFVRPGSGYARAWPTDWPTATLTTSHTRALLVPSGGTRNEDARSVGEPFRTRTTSEWEGLLVPVEGREGKHAASTGDPMRTQTARHETALVVPYYGTGQARPAGRPMPTMTTVDTAGLAFIAELRGGGSDARHVAEPLATVCASGNHHMLVRHNTARGNPGQMCTPVTEPARTLTTAGHQSLVGWPDSAPAAEDCTFRMLSVREIQAAMAFTPDYVITGSSKRVKVRQLGNGVTPPAAEWLVGAAVASLERSAGRRRTAA
ncbi:DNA cytosine methyltransferase [Amycolatopsis sp. NPDC051128]|uniref:DNA cytosine methyltransferase n=1 Tax=Amycolatopsis sp. NPDC051128 TaxID=3155412 RepID=UPI00342E2B65